MMGNNVGQDIVLIIRSDWLSCCYIIRKEHVSGVKKVIKS